MNEYFVHGLAALGAGIAMLCCVGHGIGQGFATGKAVEAAGRNPEASNKIQALLVIGLALAETTGIFALIVAILLIFTK